MFRSAYMFHERVFTDVSGLSRTKQNFKDECDINVIMRRYETHGVLPAFNQREGRFMDTTVFHFQDAQQVVAAAKSAFEELPARLRDRFKNDPSQLIEFLNDERNRDEAIKLGLVNPTPLPPAPVQVVVADIADGAKPDAANFLRKPKDQLST